MNRQILITECLILLSSMNQTQQVIIIAGLIRSKRLMEAKKMAARMNNMRVYGLLRQL